MAESILYQNASKLVTVLDLPRSIAQGQGSTASLLSTRGPHVPYPSTEPRGKKRDKLLSQIPEAERALHHGICDVLLSALHEARNGIGDRDWCHQRQQQTNLDESRRLAIDTSEIPSQVIDPPLFLSGFEDRLFDFNVLRRCLIVNPLKSGTTLAIDADVFNVPARSTFICSTVAGGMHLFDLAIKMYCAALGRKELHFDFVLLDPPWANRSVRHAKTYQTTETQEDPFGEVLPIVRQHVTPNSVVAIWVTNKAALRELVLCAMGDFELFEEWIWLKVSTNGSPVTDMDGIWRKPYEVLMLFRKAGILPAIVLRRIVIAVPDMHSRKPCLKALIEPLLPQSYLALELFARSLTAGWWSWGDECLKFQHESHWSENS